MAIIATGAAQPGDVIVMAANSDLEGHTWGSGLTLSAKNVGCEGVVVDGLVIDSDSILALQVPVFCRGSTLRSKGTEELGSVNVPVVCGGAASRSALGYAERSSVGGACGPTGSTMALTVKQAVLGIFAVFGFG